MLASFLGVRRFLDNLYRGSGLVAVVLLAAIVIVVLAQIVGRLVNVVVPGVTQGAGFFMAAYHLTVVRCLLATKRCTERHSRWKWTTWSGAISIRFPGLTNTAFS